MSNEKILHIQDQRSRNVGDRPGVFTFTPDLQASERAEPVDIQMLECHVDHGVQDIVVLSNTVGV